MKGEHVLPLRSYLGVFGALMFFTALTTGIAYVHLGVLNDVIALGIASTKAVLVLLFFMHVKYASKLVWIFCTAGFFWLLILFTLTLADFATRIPVPGWSG